MALSPMMKQYFEIKDNYKDTILMFRLGDFYEMFYEDAIVVSKELDLTLTGRDCGMEERAPMCGVPYHALDTYLAKLVEKGYKVAICEQITPPSARAIVKREVIRVVTPGTITQSAMLNEKTNNFIASIYFSNNKVGISWSDITTGEFNHQLISEQIAINLNDLLSRIEPSEIICNSEMLAESINLSIVKFGALCPFTVYNDVAYDYENAYNILSKQLSKENLKLLEKNSLCVSSAGALVNYLNETQKRALNHIKTVSIEDSQQNMLLDSSVRRTLELTKSANDGKRHGSLLWLIDKTATDMGARMLHQWIEQPSINEKIINDRLDFVEELTRNAIACDKLHQNLSEIHDIQRLASRLSLGNFSPRDCIALAQSLNVIPAVKVILESCTSPLTKALNENIHCFENVIKLINSSIIDAPANLIRDGGVIKEGYNVELDDCRSIGKNAKTILAKLERDEKEETGIKNLKIGYNKIFGYYIEILKSQLALVPYRYIRKQTIATGERYITDELKTIETKILHSEELSISLEIKLYDEIIKKLSQFIDEILATANNIAYLDCLVSNALLAKANNYSKPEINSSIKNIKIIEGRHCVVEKLLKGEDFVPNDTLLDENENRIMLITGPNMAGKSIYMRQVALITILAHIGSFVPAKKAEISITDRIFTRVGASDDLSTGRSTFMVEMSEVAQILENITPHCLILMDEIGRGTATYDGLSIAWSIIEFLSAHTTAKILFSTHYHELTELEGVINGVKNYKLTVREFNNTIIFLRKLMRGSANKSFGIEVANLAGIPNDIVKRSKELLRLLENSDISRKEKMSGIQQISIFNDNVAMEVSSILKDIDLDNISPRHALDILTDLKEKVTING